MAERAHPFDVGFKDKLFGFRKNPYKKALFERYNFCNKYVKNKIVLDIPCGTAWGSSRLVGYKKLIGMDVSKDAIDFATLKYKTDKTEYLVGRMEKIELLDNSIDVIVCLEGFEHITKKHGLQFLEEAKRILKKKGILIMTSPVIEAGKSGSGNPYHLYEYPEHELVEILNNNFQFLEYKKVNGPELPIVYFVGVNEK